MSVYLHIYFLTYIYIHIIYKDIFLTVLLMYCIYQHALAEISFPDRIRCDLLWPATPGQTIFQTLPFLFLEQRENIPLLTRCGHHVPATSFAILHSPPFVANPQRIHISHGK